jgi:hypothetical protein
MIIRNSFLILFFLLFQYFGTGSKGYAQVFINEIMSANLSSIQDEFWTDKQVCPVEDCDWWFEQMGEETWDGDYPDWIELYNAGSSAVNLNGYGLSDNIDVPYKWTFPSVSINAGARLVIFASGRNITNPEPGNLMHTNFKISRKGESIILTNALGDIADQYDLGELPPDFSTGRLPDGGSNWKIFENPTPQSANGGTLFSTFSDVLTSSHEAGFYPGAISVSLSTTTIGAQIRYTLDGSEPDLSSDIYSAPINISSSSVLKAKTYVSGSTASKVLTSSYIIGNTYSLPVISLSTAPDNFWDDDIGIYVHGTYPVYHDRVANYWQDWERPVTIEFFEADGSHGFTLPAGAKIFGWGSRVNDRKSLSIFFRDKYGESKLQYPLFEDLPISEFKSIVLRAGGNDWQSTILRDEFASSLVSDKNVDHQRYRAAVVYINGEYWGIHTIREKLNEDYLNAHYNIDKDRVDMISRYWRKPYPIIIEGSDTAYLEMENYAAANDMNKDEAYDYIKAIVDIDNFVDYLVPEIFYANYDWPGNNTKCWKPKTAHSKWRWLLYDLDYTLASHDWQNGYTHNTLEHATNAGGTGWPNTTITTLLIREMMEGDKFRNSFVNRMADNMNSRFIADTSVDHLRAMQAVLAPEMQEHIDRWGSYGSLNSISAWNGNIDDVENFLQNRIPQVKNHIEDFFNLAGWDNFTVNVSEQGKIKVNSIIPSNYPWTGQYVNDIPITLTALPKAGYRFAGWTGVSGPSSSTRITLLISEAAMVTANFEEDASGITPIVINEINYNSPVDVFADDWVELYNPTADAVDISGWVFKDSDDWNTFVLPANTIIPPDSYLVLSNDSADFKEVFPAVNNYIGEFFFGLSSAGETLRLFNAAGELVDRVAYGSSSPWPPQANGFGPSLSLLDPSLDNAFASSWGYSLAYGTPGSDNENYTYINIPDYVPGLTTNNSDIRLDQNYPNPFTENTHIAFYLPEAAKVTISVFDIKGTKIEMLYSGKYEAGSHVVDYDAANLPHGIYYYRLETGDVALVNRMIKL